MEPQRERASTSNAWEPRSPALSIASSIGQAAMIHMSPTIGSNPYFYAREEDFKPAAPAPKTPKKKAPPASSFDWEGRPPASSISSIGQAAMVLMAPPIASSPAFYPYPDDVKVEPGSVKSNRTNAAIIGGLIGIAILATAIIVILEVTGVFGETQPKQSS